MGRELFDQSPIYQGTIERLDNVLQNLPESPAWSLRLRCWNQLLAVALAMRDSPSLCEL
jgi:hypothetical protein